MRSTKRSHRSRSNSTNPIGTEITDEDIERYLARVEEEEAPDLWNLPTAAGLGLIAVGTAYVLEQLGFWEGTGLEILAQMLPWLAGILVILIGLGLISRPSTATDSAKETHDDGTADTHESPRSTTRSTDSVSDPTIGQAAKNFLKAVRHTARERHLVKSSNKRISGVCGGLGEYFDVDPTFVRIGFVIATLFGGGAPVLIYIGLMIAMPGPDDQIDEETRVTVTRN